MDETSIATASAADAATKTNMADSTAAPAPTVETPVVETPMASAVTSTAVVATISSTVAAATTESEVVIPNSMWKSDELIQEGALVILFENRNSLTYCYVKKNEVFHNRHGGFHHDDMIGKPYGTKILSRHKKTKGYMILLAPTPELWSRALRHRTQIVFTLDASAIMFSASLRSGSRVVESGTGSGALTTSFARTVAPHGHVFTFEFNPTRAEIAREEFARNGLESVITVDCRDACEQGFPEELAGTIDLVFLDLPCPWKAIGHAAKMLKQGGNFASYSPCIEQVQKTCDGLREAGFEMIRTIETRLVPYSARNIDLPTPDFGFGPGPSTVAAADASAVEGESETTTTNGKDSSENETDSKPAAAPVVGKKRRFNGEHVVAKKDDEIRGHTAFLTFAFKFFAATYLDGGQPPWQIPRFLSLKPPTTDEKRLFRPHPLRHFSITKNEFFFSIGSSAHLFHCRHQAVRRVSVCEGGSMLSSTSRCFNKDSALPQADIHAGTTRGMWCSVQVQPEQQSQEPQQQHQTPPFLDSSFFDRTKSRRSVLPTSAPLLASATAIATPKKQLKLWRLRLPLVYNVALIFVFVLLDVQDLLYKIIWVGPNESFSFRTEVMGVLRDSVLVPSDPSFNVPGTIDVDQHASSWPHFLSSCVNLTAMDAGGGFFAIALGSSCTIGQGNARRSIDNLIMSSSVRLDSIVWTVCRLLYQWQQPFICRSPIVTKYLHRYVLPDMAVNISSLAEPGSDAEKELLVFLDMVSKSYPLHKMVCVEAFEWTNQSLGTFRTSFYGCASPNLMRSEFLGLSNPVIRELHRDRAWLTSDVFHWFGLRFGIRQNARNNYVVEKISDDKIRTAAHTTPNFTCFGPLYSVMIGLDFLLLMMNFCSYWEFVERVLIPRSNELVRRHRRHVRETQKIIPRTTRRRFAQADLIRKLSKKSLFRTSVKVSPRSNLTMMLVQPSWIPVEHLDLEELKCLLPCSLQRSWPGIFAVIASQVLSWMIIMPNSVVWVWGLSTTTKIQAFLTSLRVWMLLVVSCNFLWDCVVKINEEWAFFVTSRTFVTPVELVVIGAAITAWKILDIFLMCERKWAIESQRVNDVSAFAGGYIAHGNTYQPSVEVLFSTPAKIVAILYGPLFQIIGASILCLIVYLGLKGAVLHRWAQRKPDFVLSTDRLQLSQRKEKYKRLPMEEESNCPIRAKSLVRTHMEMEHTFQSQQYIRPYCYLECGLLPRQTWFTTRVGFTNFLPPKYEKRTRILQAKQWKLE